MQVDKIKVDFIPATVALMALMCPHGVDVNMACSISMVSHRSHEL